MRRYSWLCLLFAVTVSAQELPNAPSHKFWDRTNKALAITSGAFATADAITTQRGLNRGFYDKGSSHRIGLNKGAAGQAVFTVGILAVQGGSSYLLHKTGHHKLERLPWLVGIQQSSYGFIHNLRELN